MTVKLSNARPARLVTAIYLISCVQFLCPACTSKSADTSDKAARTGRSKAGTDRAFLAVVGLKRPSHVLRRVITLAVLADPRLSGVPAEVFANAVQAGLMLRYPALDAIDLERPVRVFLAVLLETRGPLLAQERQESARVVIHTGELRRIAPKVWVDVIPVVGHAGEIVPGKVPHVLVALVERLIADAVADGDVAVLVKIAVKELQRLALVLDGRGGRVFAALDT